LDLDLYITAPGFFMGHCDRNKLFIYTYMYIISYIYLDVVPFL